MYIVGRRVSKGYPYWKSVIWVVVLFTIVEGARYGRGVDYLHYVDIYNYNLHESSTAFFLINNFLKIMGITAVYAFGFYALPFILGGTVLLERMRNYAAYMFPLFLICFIVFHEAFIRQALATSFYFLFIAKLFSVIEDYEKQEFKKKTIIPLAIYVFLAVSLHSVQIIGFIVATLVILFLRKPLHWIYTIPLLLLGKFHVAQNFDWGSINGLLGVLSNDDTFAVYADNADYWFSGDAMVEGYTRNTFIQFLETLACCSLLYLGFKVCNHLVNRVSNTGTIFTPINIYVSIFNIVVVGLLVYQTFYNLELVRRVSYCWYLLWFVPVALVLFYTKHSDLFSKFDKILMIGFFFWIWEYIRFLFVFVEEPKFIWDM